jgi:hypothetical protein
MLTTNTNIWTTSLAPMPTPPTAPAIEVASKQSYRWWGLVGRVPPNRVKAHDGAIDIWITEQSVAAVRYEGSGAAEIGGWF